MKIENTGNELTTQGVEVVEGFDISPEDVVLVMTILRSTLYSDKPLAIMREYGANAWDSHRESGCPDRPIKVTLPTASKPTLKIRDYGRGLSEQEVLKVYTKYGRSTKRQSNIATGFLGIGSKSGFAYGDQFTVTAWHGGAKRTFVASLDPTGRGVMQKLDEEPCSAEETGVEIQIAVRPKDLQDFHQKARRLYRHYDPQPEINLDLPQEKRTRLQHGYIVLDSVDYYSRADWVAVMGCNPYRIDIDQLEDKGTSLKLFRRLHGALYFDIGEIDHSASREGLEYTDKTKEAIERKAALLLDEYTTESLRALHSSEVSPWEKRHRVRFLKHELKVTIPEDMAHLADDVVPLAGQHFKVDSFGGGHHNGVRVHAESTLVLRDDTRKLSGFDLRSSDFVVTPRDGHDLKQVEEELPGLLEKAGLTGIRVRRTSEVQWYARSVDPKQKEVNPKHKVAKATFRLKSRVCFDTPYSNHWEIEEREPQDDDVFVILEAFQPVDDRLYSTYAEDAAIIQAMGGTMPPIYGYKNTLSKPIKAEQCKGKLYSQWRDEYILGLMTDADWEMVNQWQWSQIVSSPYRPWEDREKDTTWMAKVAAAELGADHPVSRFMEKHVKAKSALSRHSKEAKRAEYLANLAGTLGKRGRALRNPAKEAERTLFTRYPLLGLSDIGLSFLLGTPEDRQVWYGYLRLVDAASRNPAQDQASVA